MVFYLVRHGQTDWNNERRFQGQLNIPMNETGIRQIHDLADRMVRAGVRFDVMIASPLDRAKQSAEIIAEKTGFQREIIFDADLMERNCGTLEGKIWHPGLNLDDPRYKMETLEALCERAKRALGKYTFSNEEKVMIVSHGGMIAALRMVLSDYKMDYHDKTVPVLQGNVLCCVKEEGKETVFFNLFETEDSREQRSL